MERMLNPCNSVSNFSEDSYYNTALRLVVTALFNQHVSEWDVSNVTKTKYMFPGASAFHQDLSGWAIFNDL